MGEAAAFRVCEPFAKEWNTQVVRCEISSCSRSKLIFGGTGLRIRSPELAVWLSFVRRRNHNLVSVRHNQLKVGLTAFCQPCPLLDPLFKLETLAPGKRFKRQVGIVGYSTWTAFGPGSILALHGASVGQLGKTRIFTMTLQSRVAFWAF